jgi:hypothetical protein
MRRVWCYIFIVCRYAEQASNTFSLLHLHYRQQQLYPYFFFVTDKSFVNYQCPGRLQRLLRDSPSVLSSHPTLSIPIKPIVEKPMSEGYLVWSNSEKQLFHLPPHELARHDAEKGRAWPHRGITHILVVPETGGLQLRSVPATVQACQLTDRGVNVSFCPSVCVEEERLEHPPSALSINISWLAFCGQSLLSRRGEWAGRPELP